MSRPASPVVRTLRRLAALLLTGSLPLAATPAPDAPKTHTLFLGSDLQLVTKEGKLIPVRDVRDHAFVGVDAKGKQVTSAGDDDFRLKIDEALKLTARSATLEKINFERTYSLGANPMAKVQDAIRVGNYLASSRDVSDQDVRWAESLVGAAGDAPGRAAAEGALAAAQADNAASSRSFDTAQSNSISQQASLTSELSDGPYDALNVTFAISAPRPIQDGYVVIMMRFLAKADDPKSAGTWVYAERLPEIDEHPRQILIRRGGFPPGYHIESYQLHLYERGSELATNVARKRVPLAEADAFLYAVTDYLAANRGQTKRPAKADAFWPTDLHQRLGPDKLSRLIHVKVDRDGFATGLFEDEGCTRPVADDQLATLARELRFLPALDQGKPVAGVAAIKLGRPN